MKEELKNVVRAIWRSGIYRRVLFGLDRLAFTVARPAKTQQPYTLLLAPPTGENIGDQAMFDSAIHNTAGKVLAVTMSDSYRKPVGDDGERALIRVLPGHIHRPPLVRFGVMLRLSGLIKSAQAFIAPGADTVDGGHTHGSLARLSIIRLAAIAGIPTTLQGFSWKSDAPASVVRAVTELAERGVQVSPRDPVSRRRLTEAGVQPTTQVADLAFAYPVREALPERLKAQIARVQKSGRPIVLLNTSGLIARRHDLTADYGVVIERLHSVGATVVFTPHVDRAWDDDFAMARKVKELYGNADDVVVDSLLSPAQVRELASFASLVVTGRMHLAILSLSQEIPVVCLATHGKVEGLFEFFEMPDLVVEPQAGNGELLAEKASAALQNRDALVAQIRTKLPAVIELSKNNFANTPASGLDTPKGAGHA